MTHTMYDLVFFENDLYDYDDCYVAVALIIVELKILGISAP